MLNRKTYFIREHVGLLKLSDTFDIIDPETRQQIGIAKEKPGFLILILRAMTNKKYLPTKVFIYEGTDHQDESKLLFSLKRGFTIFRSRVNVLNNRGEIIGWLRSRIFTLGGAFSVFDSKNNEIALVKGDWTGWNFRFLDKSENEIGTITKKWAGVGKELFSSADNYIISLNNEPKENESILLLAAGLAVDIVYKEN